MIALGGLVLRVAYVLRARREAPPLGKDGTWYGLQAGAIGDGAGYVDPGALLRVPGRGRRPRSSRRSGPRCSRVVYTVGLGTLRAYRIAGGFIGAATVVMTAYIGRRLVDHRVGLIAAAIRRGLPVHDRRRRLADGREPLPRARDRRGPRRGARSQDAPGLGWFALLGLAARPRHPDPQRRAARRGRCSSAVTAWCDRPGRRAVGSRLRRRRRSRCWSWCSSRGRCGTSTRSTSRSSLSNNSGSLLGRGELQAELRGSRHRRVGTSDCAAVLERRRRTESRRRAEPADRRPRPTPREHPGPTRRSSVPLRVVRGWGLVETRRCWSTPR